MEISTIQQLSIALNGDLKKAGPTAFSELVNNSGRRTFTTHKDGAVFEFDHKQPDSDFWNGSKYYGSGRRSKIRISRTQVATAPESKPKAEGIKAK